MNTVDKVAVTSRSFSRHQHLRAELLERYQNVTFNNDGLKLAGNSLVDYLKGHNKAITALESLDAQVLSQLPELKVISKYGVGTDMIDLAAVRRHGIQFGWTGGVNKRSVAELALSFMIMSLRHIPVANSEVRDRIWRQHVGHQLTGKTVGIIGCGHVGKDLTRLLQPFKCNILVYDIQDYPDFYEEYGIQVVSLDDLLSMADLVTVHLPFDRSTRNIMNSSKLSLMKSSAILINTARGGLVDETKLKDMLINGDLAAAAFDVFLTEPPEDYDLLNLPNFIATPHLGGSSEEGILAMGRAAIRGLDDAKLL